MRSAPALAALMLLLVPAGALAAEFDSLVVLRGSVTVSVGDDRPADQQGDGNLGWFKVYDRSGADYDIQGGGPDNFSLRGTVERAFVAAADEFGVFTRPAHKGDGPHVTLIVKDLWCENSRDWDDCHGRIEGRLRMDGVDETFVAAESTSGGLRELRPLLQEALLLELSALPSASTLKEVSVAPPGAVLRYGWLTLHGGTLVHGVLAEEPSGDLCVVRDGDITGVALADLIDVDVRDVHLPGIRERGRWLMARFDDGRHLGGVVVERDGDDVATWVRARDGVYRLPPDTTAEVTEGRWRGAPPTCEPMVALRGREELEDPDPNNAWAEPDLAGRTRLRSREPDPRGDAYLVLVDADGRDIGQTGDYWDSRLYAVDSTNAGSRRWKRYRMSWQDFANRTEDPTVQLAIDEYVQGHRRRVRTGKVLIGVGIGTAILSGVLTGALAVAQLNDTNLLFDENIWGLTAAAAGGIGTGVGLAIGGQIGVFVSGRKANGASRYENLLEILTFEEIQRALDRIDGTPHRDGE